MERTALLNIARVLFSQKEVRQVIKKQGTKDRYFLSGTQRKKIQLAFGFQCVGTNEPFVKITYHDENVNGDEIVTVRYYRPSEF